MNYVFALGSILVISFYSIKNVATIPCKLIMRTTFFLVKCLFHTYLFLFYYKNPLYLQGTFLCHPNISQNIHIIFLSHTLLYHILPTYYNKLICILYMLYFSNIILLCAIINCLQIMNFPNFVLCTM